MDFIMPVMMVSAGMAGILHIGFFLLESLFWTSPAVMKIFGRRGDEPEALRIMAFNQGFYNLFLAAGTIIGMALYFTVYRNAGFIITATCCAVMLGAAAVLALSSPKMLRGALIQGVPPFMFLLLLALR